MAESAREKDKKYDQKIKQAEEAVNYLNVVRWISQIYSRTTNRPFYPDMIAYALACYLVEDAKDDDGDEEKVKEFANIVAKDFLTWLLVSGDMVIADSYDDFWEESRELVQTYMETFLEEKVKLEGKNEPPAD